jgi:phosphohistidine phosphatase
MELYLLRHGIAVEPGTPGYEDDSRRPLTPKGEAKMEQIVRAMKALELSFDHILSSPYVRTRQTAEIVARAFDAARKLEFSNSLAPGGNWKKLIEAIEKLDSPANSVLLVGHEPYLSGLISLLLSGDSGWCITMKKGGLCKLTVDALKHGRCAELEWLLTPKQMELMA